MKIESNLNSNKEKEENILEKEEKKEKENNKEEFSEKLTELKEKHQEKINTVVDNLKEEYDSLQKEEKVDQRIWVKKIDKIVKKVKKLFHLGLEIAIIAGIASPLEGGEITKKLPFDYLRDVENKVKKMDVSVNVEIPNIDSEKYKVEYAYFNKEDLKIFVQEATKIAAKEYQEYASQSGEELKIPEVDVVIASEVEDIEIPKGVVGVFVPELDKIVVNSYYAGTIMKGPQENTDNFFERMGVYNFSTIFHETIHAIDHKNNPKAAENELIIQNWIDEKTSPKSMKEVDLRLELKKGFDAYTEKNAMNMEINCYHKLIKEGEEKIKELEKEKKEGYQKKIDEYQKYNNFLNDLVEHVENSLLEVKEGTYNNLDQSINWVKKSMYFKLLNQNK